MNYGLRQKRAKEQMGKTGIDALLITHLPNVRYLCGFTGSAGVLALHGDRPAFFTDGRYSEQAKKEVVGAGVKVGKRSAMIEAVD
jgi:Xaa-Pro aminopeptidase